jgi:hypothetical protein
MRIVAISPFTNASRADILRFLAGLPRSLVLLPGRSSNTPSPNQIQRIIRRGSWVFVEGPGTKEKRPGRKKRRLAFLVSKGSIRTMPSQLFSVRPTAGNIDQLVALLPQRTFRFGKRSVTFLICGEILAFNPDGTTKHRRKLHFDILANPSHTVMGHWNHLGKKLKVLSRRSVAVHVANNDRNHHLKTDVRIYKDGVPVKRSSDINIAWSECVI